MAEERDWSVGGWKKVMSSGARGRYRQVERRWIMEYIMTKCKDAIYRVAHKRLGALPPDLLTRTTGVPASTLKVYLPYVDAVCVFPDRIELIEFKVHDPLKAVAQLIYYKTLALQDEELKRFMPRPIVLKLVYWRYDANLDAVCRANGIVLEVDKPVWLDPILRSYGYKV